MEKNEKKKVRGSYVFAGAEATERKEDVFGGFIGLEFDVNKANTFAFAQQIIDRPFQCSLAPFVFVYGYCNLLSLTCHFTPKNVYEIELVSVNESCFRFIDEPNSQMKSILLGFFN